MNISTTTQTPATIDLNIPAEPALGSVVLDRDGVAWQSRSGPATGKAVWYSTGFRGILNLGEKPEYGSTRWALLFVERAPLTIVHRGDEPLIVDA